MPASPVNKKHVPRAKKSLGQHFLRREEICDRIAALLLPQAEEQLAAHIATEKEEHL